MYEYMANGSLKDHLHCMFSFVSILVYAQNIYLNFAYVFLFEFSQHLEGSH